MRIATWILTTAFFAGFCSLGSISAGGQAAGKDGTHRERASLIKGMYVKNTKGDDLGRIEDLAITCRLGNVLYAVVEHGGVLGFGEKHIAVPLSALKRETGKDGSHLVLDISKEALDKLAGFNLNDWPTMPDEQFRKAATATEKVPDRTHFRRASYLIGMAARNPKGDSLGTIRDLMIDCREAKVIYAVLGRSTGRFSAERHFAVPWQSVDLRSLTGRPADECFVIQADPAALDKNPGFSQDNWPATGDANLFKTVQRK